jgi:hypothetical protein
VKRPCQPLRTSTSPARFSTGASGSTRCGSSARALRARYARTPTSTWRVSSVGDPSPLELLAIQAELGEALGVEVDLIDLDRTSPILAMQVLQHGRLLVDRDPRHRTAFFARTISMYEDLKIVRRGAEQALLQRVSGGRS